MSLADGEIIELFLRPAMFWSNITGAKHSKYFKSKLGLGFKRKKKKVENFYFQLKYQGHLCHGPLLFPHSSLHTQNTAFCSAVCVKVRARCDWEQQALRESSSPKAHFNICKTMAHWRACTMDWSASGRCHKPLSVCLWACVCVSGANTC